MGIMDFFRRGKAVPEPPKEPGADIMWIKGIHLMHPDAFVCFEGRPVGTCKTISAVVLPDPENETTTVIVNVSLQWLPGMMIGRITPEMQFGTENLNPPQLFVHEKNMYQFNQASEARLILVGKDKATYIAFPWEKTYFHILQNTSRWIFWSLTDEDAKKDAYYWGVGQFGDAEKFDKYIADRVEK